MTAGTGRLRCGRHRPTPKEARVGFDTPLAGARCYSTNDQAAGARGYSTNDKLTRHESPSPTPFATRTAFFTGST
ncbi:hypothetical protein GCM10028801_25580 [Nocardioides maradonensis]